MIEIERKFLVASTLFMDVFSKKYEIAQGYLNSNPNRTVRIRTKDEKGYLTVKGKSNSTGLSRFEWEKEIDWKEAKQLLGLCENGMIEKTRYEVKVEKHLFEVDVFYGVNKGLIIAEIELNSEDEIFEKPEWLGKEVTNDERFYNAYLSNCPFTTW